MWVYVMSMAGYYSGNKLYDYYKVSKNERILARIVEERENLEATMILYEIARK